MYVLFAVLGGVSVVLSRMVNASLGARIGIYQSAFYNYATGLAVSVAVLLLSGEAAPAFMQAIAPGQYYMYFGGLLGLLTVLISNAITPKMSAFVLTLLIFISQLAFGILLDLWMGGGISPGKVIGGILVLLGLVYNQSLDRRMKDAQAQG